MTKPRKGLTDKQIKFCEEYLVDLNAMQAAIRSGYSKKCASEIGYENLTKPQIQEKIAELRDDLAKKKKITRERIAEEYAKIGFFDPRKLYNQDGLLKPVPELDDETAGAISAVDVSEYGIPEKIKTSDKRAALDSLVKLFGYAEPDRVQLETEDISDEKLAKMTAFLIAKADAKQNGK